MKPKFNKLLLAISSAYVLAQTAQAVPTANGDLIIGFYQVIGGAVQADTFIFNLGKAATYRENTQSNVSVTTIVPAVVSSNIGADLAAVFGSDWAESGTVFWTVFGGADQTTVGVVDGDVARSSYISIPVSSFVVGKSTIAPPANGGSRPALSNSIEAIRANSNNLGTLALPGGNPRGTVIPAKGPVLDTSIDGFFPPSEPSQLSLGSELRGLFGAGTIAGSTGLEGALDLFRYVNSVSASGVDLTSGFGGSNAALGVGQYVGTITIDATGELKIFGAAPAAGSYFTFAAANGLTGGPTADSDFDGINNLTEYALNTNLTGSDGSVGTFSGGLLSFTKRPAAVTNGDLTYAIEESTDLGISDPWAPLAGTTNNSTTISGTLPTGPGIPKQFGRLRILSNAVAP